METLFIMCLGACCLYLLIQSLSQGGSSTFTSSEMRAFKKAKQVREDLKTAEGLVGPPKADPDTTYTLTIKDKKPDP